MSHRIIHRLRRLTQISLVFSLCNSAPSLRNSVFLLFSEEMGL
jgi:hypothetical protein